ncbi:hypothetical protein B27N_03737, partial [Alcanivorax marinus]|nr:hypothetical protein [Alloalcanivorax marinus]
MVVSLVHESVPERPGPLRCRSAAGRAARVAETDQRGGARGAPGEWRGPPGSEVERVAEGAGESVGGS